MIHLINHQFWGNPMTVETLAVPGDPGGPHLGSTQSTRKPQAAATRCAAKLLATTWVGAGVRWRMGRNG